MRRINTVPSGGVSWPITRIRLLDCEFRDKSFGQGQVLNYSQGQEIIDPQWKLPVYGMGRVQTPIGSNSRTNMETRARERDQLITCSRKDTNSHCSHHPTMPYGSSGARPNLRFLCLGAVSIRKRQDFKPLYCPIGNEVCITYPIKYIGAVPTTNLIKCGPRLGAVSARLLMDSIGRSRITNNTGGNRCK